MTAPARILIIEDDLPIQQSLSQALRSAGYTTNIVATVREALQVITLWTPDLIVLDVGLVDAGAARVSSELRNNALIPIIVLSARDRNPEKIRAVAIDADDYVIKPFTAELMLTRVQVALQPVASNEPRATGWVRYKGLSIDYGRHRVLRGRKEIRLTPKEFQLLALLAQKAGGLLTHSTILKAIWGPHAVDHPEHVWVLVAQLRRKIEVDPSNPRYVVNEPWFGYRFASESVE